MFNNNDDSHFSQPRKPLSMQDFIRAMEFMRGNAVREVEFNPEGLESPFLKRIPNNDQSTNNELTENQAK